MEENLQKVMKMEKLEKIKKAKTKENGVKIGEN